jgi:hypothetical protein
MRKIALFVVLAGVSLLGSMRAEAAAHVGGLGLGGSGGSIMIVHADSHRGGWQPGPPVGHPIPPVGVSGGSGGGAVGNGAGGNVCPQVNCGHTKPQVR